MVDKPPDSDIGSPESKRRPSHQAPASPVWDDIEPLSGTTMAMQLTTLPAERLFEQCLRHPAPSKLLNTLLEDLANRFRCSSCRIILIQGSYTQCFAASSLSSHCPSLSNLEAASEWSRKFSEVEGHTVIPAVAWQLPFGESDQYFLHCENLEASWIAPQQLNSWQHILSAMGCLLLRIHSSRELSPSYSFNERPSSPEHPSLSRYVDYFESAADGVVILDLRGKLLFGNPRALELIGYTRARLKDSTITDLVPKEEAEQLVQFLGSFRSEDGPQHLDIRVRRGDGSMMIISANISTLLRQEAAILVTFRDVTAERETERQFRRTTEFLTCVIESSVDAIVASDLKGRILLFNRAASRLFGYSLEKSETPKHVTELYPKGGAREVMNMIRSPGYGGLFRVEDLRVQMKHRDGSEIPVRLSASMMFEANRSIGSLGIFTDIRGELKMKARLDKAQEVLADRQRETAVAQLAGGLAHELNQPLTSVIAYADLLSRKLKTDESSFEATQALIQQADRMAEIVKRLGQITRYETQGYVGDSAILDLKRSSDVITAVNPEKKS